MDVLINIQCAASTLIKCIFRIMTVKEKMKNSYRKFYKFHEIGVS